MPSVDRSKPAVTKKSGGKPIPKPSKDAKASAANAPQVSPEEIHTQATHLLAHPPRHYVRAADYYQRLLNDMQNELAALRSTVARMQRDLSPEARQELEQSRSQWTGLESGKGGNVSIDFTGIKQRAQDFAARVGSGEMAPASAVEFERTALGVASDVTDAQVRRRFSNLLVSLSAEDKVEMETAQVLAMGRSKKVPTTGYDVTAMVERAKAVANDVVQQGTPVSLTEFYQRALGYETSNFPTLTVRASQYRKRLTPEQQQEFDDSRQVAIGKKPTGGQVFAPDADQMDEQRANLATTPGGFQEVTLQNEPMSTPADGPEMDGTLPGFGLPDDVNPTTEQILVLPADEWQKWQVPPTVTRPSRPSSATPPPEPELTLDPATVAILAVAGLLIVIDGPLPFGDAAAASLVGGRLAICF